MNQKNYNNKTRGFSLVETLIYVSLLVVIMTIVIASIYTMVRTQRQIKYEIFLQESAMTAIDRIVREIRDAQGVDVSSVFGSNPGRLELNGVDLSNNPRNVEFYVSNGRIIMEENDVVVGPITSSNARVSSLIFFSINSSGSDAIRTELTLTAGTSTQQRTEKFYMTTVLRSSY